MTKTPASNNSAAAKPGDKPGFLRRTFTGFWSQQREMAYPPHVAELNRDVFKAYKTIFGSKIQPKRVETFEAAVKRQGLSEEFLAEQLDRLKNLQVIMYLMGGAILLYAFWLFLYTSVLFGAVTAFWGAGILIRGYLYAYRAWQIANRDLIRLQDAIRIKSTYLVL